MKNVRFLVALMVSVCLSSCLDSEEKIVLNADNSGTYAMTLDMGKVFAMANSMGAQSNADKPKEKKDTVIYLKNFLDSATNLTAEEKQLYRDGALSMKMDEEKGEMKIVVSCPFKNIEALTAIKSNLFSVIKKIKAFEKASGERSPEEEGGEDAKMDIKSTNPVADQFTFHAAPGVISNTVKDMEAFKSKIASDSTLTMMRQMSGMMGDFKYKTVLVLPKKIKKFEGPGSVVAEDKQTVTFETTLTEMMEHPEKASYKVEY